MTVLIEKARVIDPGGEYHRKLVNITLENGTIQNISSDPILGEFEVTIKSENLFVSSGWCDLRCRSGEPGKEYLEDLHTLTKAAAAGGFTKIVTLPNTSPVVQTKEAVKFQSTAVSPNVVSILPSAAVTVDAEGKQLTEMYDLHHAGAKAFTDGNKTLWHSGILMKALQYVQHFDGVIMNHSFDEYLSHHGLVREGEMSTRKGLKGIPDIAESIRIERDLEILRYAGGKLHFNVISTRKGVDLIRQAKKEGLSVTCDVSVGHLLFTEGDVANFDTNYKVLPPYGNPEDRAALSAGILDGTVDAIVSDHQPWDEDAKKLEFDYADFGVATMETVFPMLIQSFGEDHLDKLIPALVHNPRGILGEPVSTLKIGDQADLTCFDPSFPWEYNTKTKYSKGMNSPFFNATLKGAVLATVQGGQSWIR